MKIFIRKTILLALLATSYAHAASLDSLLNQYKTESDLSKKTKDENSINLDIQDILNEDIMELLRVTFEGKKELAQRLTIEILEHEEIKNFELIQTSIMRLKEIGFSIALDDFGSGYANFRYMINLRLDILKIDGSIVTNVDKDKAAYNIVKAIVEFAKSMQMKTVAEMVETKEEHDVLIELGVDFLQGYYLGRPEFEI